MKSLDQLVHGTVIASAMLLVASCSAPPSEQEIREEFSQAVERSDDCNVDEDCVLVAPACPLGCWAAVNVDHEREISLLAQSLVFDWSRGAQSCDNSCFLAVAECVNKECEVVQAPSP